VSDSRDLAVLHFGRAICNDRAAATRREWLVTNAIGGYACGTVAGELTRKYHGLLIAATQPPGKRVLLLTALDAEVAIDGITTSLATHRWCGDVVSPHGDIHLERFELDGSVPIWTYRLGSVLLERSIWMRRGSNTTCVRWRLIRGGPVALSLRALTTHRSHHAVRPEPHVERRIELVAGGVLVSEGDASTGLLLRSDRGHVHAASGAIYRDFQLSIEAARGYAARDSHHHAATLDLLLAEGESVTVVATATDRRTPEFEPLEVERWLAEQRQHDALTVARAAAMQPAASATTDGSPARRMSDARAVLALAADQFIVRRRGPDGRTGSTIVAGYPWFEDWGRDTMIALPGLCLATGRGDVAKEILRTFAASLDRGMLPNRFPDEGGATEYHTVDATLWFVRAVDLTFRATGDEELVRELLPALHSIIDWHRRGTRHGIRVDETDGLLRSGEHGVQLTWMDARIGDWVVTPRTGKCVEINALWIAALDSIAEFTRRGGGDPSAYETVADRAARSFARFWNPSERCLYDVIDAAPHESVRDGVDASVRANQAVAAMLVRPSGAGGVSGAGRQPHQPLTAEQRRAVVDCLERELLTSHGLRTLSPRDPAYLGRYAGDQKTRDASYHRGTVWPWLLGPFIAAWRSTRRPAEEAPAAQRIREFLLPLVLHLEDAGLGSVSEVFDGDPPHGPGGCVAQAWSVAALLESMTESHFR